ncbi:MAG: hypothetical protein NTX91_03715 [candidate division SR1 bacterium]|nr:hypothetical protein [candidate division SR1 bacterium]
MKVVYPKNIRKGLFAGMTFNIGPITVSILQLFLLAAGIAMALAIFNSFAKSGSKLIGIVLAVFILLIFVAIAFFKISELSLVPFAAKMIRNNFFDTKKKFQENYTRESPVDILIKENKATEEKQVIEQKIGGLSKERISEIEKGGLV